MKFFTVTKVFEAESGRLPETWYINPRFVTRIRPCGERADYKGALSVLVMEENGESWDVYCQEAPFTLVVQL